MVGRTVDDGARGTGDGIGNGLRVAIIVTEQLSFNTRMRG